MLKNILTKPIRNCSNKLPSSLKTSTSMSSSTENKSTVDSSEISFFNALTSKWWSDKSNPVKPLHSMNQLRVPFVRDGLINYGKCKTEYINTPKPLRGLSILDVGCGGGILTEALARIGATTVGVDPSQELLKLAREHSENDPSLSNLTYIQTSIEDYAKENSEKYDAVVTSEVIEHVKEKGVYVEACVKCLKPGGSIFITTFNQTALSFAAIIASEYIFNVIPRGTHEWDKFISSHQMQRVLEDNGCYTRIIHGLVYNVLTDRWSWSHDFPISYALHAIKE